MVKLPFLERVQQGTPLLGDGATGTLLHERGNLPLDGCFDNLNLSQPELVLQVHQDYIAAGADIIETNTFGANTFKLGEYGLAEQVDAMNRAGVRLAKQAIGDREDIYILGSVGPLGVRMRPFGKLSREQAVSAFAQQIRPLVEEGVDALLLETFTDHGELIAAIEAAHALSEDVPIIAQMTFNSDERTVLGYMPGRVATELSQSGADIIGVNCSAGPAHISRVLELMRLSVPDALYSAMPNAGFPESVGGRVLYPASADYFADAALTLRENGARIIGGCCGTSPAHIRAMREALDDPKRPAPVLHVIDQGQDVDTEATAERRPTELAYRLATGQFTVTVEVAPPRSYAVEKLVNAGNLLREAGAHLLDVADSPAARMRMSPWAVCHVLQSEAGLETVLHFPTRGRNLLRVQGDLLAAHALGLRNLFVTMGDPTRIGDYPEAMDSFDIAPSKLIGLIAQEMNHGQDMAGHSIGSPTSFTVGCALNMFADDLDRELHVLDKKLASGADFALGQAVFEPGRIEQFHRAYEARNGAPFKLPVLMGIMPLYSIKQAIFLNNEVPGISIPEKILKRMEDAGSDAPAEGVRIAQEILRDVKDLVQGAYIIPAFGRYHLAAEVIDAVSIRA